MQEMMFNDCLFLVMVIILFIEVNPFLSSFRKGHFDDYGKHL